MEAGYDQLTRLLDLPLESFTDRAVKQHEREIVDLNKGQLDRGLDANGNSLGRYSSIKYKGRLQPVDLLLTGAFRNSFTIDADTGGFVINATDEKTRFLDKRYPDNRGIVDAELPTVSDLILPDILDAMHEAI